MAIGKAVMNIHRNKRVRAPLEINLIPMIDVVLVLLIFFIVTTTFTHETGIKINLPEAKGEPASAADAKVITLLIDREGNYFISMKEGDAGKLLNTARLKQELAEIRSLAPNTPFVISADGKTPHQAVIRALDLASQVGFKQIAFATKEPEVTE